MSQKMPGVQRTLKQSVMYLYQAYRDDGLDEKQAKEAVAEQLGLLQNEFARLGRIEFKPLVRPLPLLDEAVSLARASIRSGCPRRLYDILLNLRMAVKES